MAASVSGVGRHAFEHRQELGPRRPGERARRDFSLRPQPRVLRIIAHRPSRKKTLGDPCTAQKNDIEVSVVFAYARECGVDGGLRTLQQLKIYIGPTDERAGDVVALVAATGVAKDPVQHSVVEAKRLGHVD